MSEMMKNFSEMLNSQQMPENIKNILGSMNMNNSAGGDMGNSDKNTDCNSNNSSSNNCTNNNSSNNIFGDIDINTIIKIQKIMNSINNDKQNDSRTNLLMSLKPYLKESRKGKVDQYVQLMKMGKVFEIMNPLGGDKKNV